MSNNNEGPQIEQPINKIESETVEVKNKNRNLTIKEIYSIFGKLMIKHELLELDQGFNKFLNLPGINLDNDTKKIIGRDIPDKIINILKEFDYVFIKLNNKSAIDSDFLCLQLKCFSIDDILTLLKGSNRINEVFNPYYKNFLVLKPWYKIEHKFEFRLYYINKRLKGISQRYINLFEEYEDIDKIRDCIVDFNISNEMKECLEKVPIEEDSLHYMIIDVVYLEKKNKIKIIDVETLNPTENDLPLEEANPTVYPPPPQEENNLEANNKNQNKKPSQNANKKTQQEILEEENKKKKEEEEIKTREEFLENWKNKKIDKNSKIHLYTWDDLLLVDDEDTSEIELRIIESRDDSRIVEEPENMNKYPVELIEYENDLEALIRKLNMK